MRIGDLPVEPDAVVKFVTELLSPSLHEKRARSIAFGTLGAVFADRWSVAEVGRAMARARGTSPKHGIKQVDRLLSNEGFDLPLCFQTSVPLVVGERSQIVVSLDWTEYAADGHSRIAINLVTTHGRATPLVWLTVRTEALRWRRNGYEDEALELLAASLPPNVKVTVLADRGFADTKLFSLLRDARGWDFVIRIRGNMTVTLSSGLQCRVDDFVPKNCAIRELPDALLTRAKFSVSLVCTRDAGMKAPWCLATTLRGDGQRVIALYAKRFTIEAAFRDEKDLNYGLGLEWTSIGEPARRDRFLFLVMLATLLLTLLGAAGEQVGSDRQLKANTIARRTHSLLRQGKEYLMGCASRFFAEIRHAFAQLLGSIGRIKTTFALV
jgi:hypothetical protein